MEPLENARLKNLKEDLALRQRLKLLDAQFRRTLKTLQRRRTAALRENRRLLLLRVCEPRATVHNNMLEIAETERAGADARGSHTAGGRRPLPSRRSADPPGSRRSVSAPATSGGGAPAVSARSGAPGDGGRLSIMRVKDIAAIDCISRKELARRQQQARAEGERLRRLQREALHQRVKAFLEELNETDDSESPPRDE